MVVQLTAVPASNGFQYIDLTLFSKVFVHVLLPIITLCCKLYIVDIAMVALLTHCSCSCFQSGVGVIPLDIHLDVSPYATLRHRVAPCPVGTQPAFALSVRYIRRRPNFEIEFTWLPAYRCSRALLVDASQGNPVVVVVLLYTLLWSLITCTILILLILNACAPLRGPTIVTLFIRNRPASPFHRTLIIIPFLDHSLEALASIVVVVLVVVVVVLLCCL